MRFALSHGRLGPRPSGLVTGPDALARLVEEGSRQRTVRLWSWAPGIDGDGPCHALVGHWRDPGRLGAEGLARSVREAALAAARFEYLHGDCWHLAHVAGKALDRPVAVARAPHHGEHPDHLAVDLGGGLYLDVRGVLDEAGLLAGLHRESRVAETMPATDVPLLHAAVYGGDEEVLSWEESHVASGYGAETEALFSAFLEAGAREAMAPAAVPRP